MNSLVLMLLAFIGYLVAYHTYGRFLARKLFRINEKNLVPAHASRDDVDFVPTPKHIVFGHHFTTIAGLGPIVGPAIGIIWGWLPAFLWIFFGSILMGAFHDFAALVVSSRNKGQTLGELTGKLISPSTRFAFQAIMQFLLFIVLAVFAMIVGVLFKAYPESVIPVWFQVPVAIWLGRMIKAGKNDIFYSVVAVALLYASIWLGIQYPIHVKPLFGDEVVTWCLILYAYVFVASSLPVQTLLQPRDYINSHQLLVSILLLIAGIVVAHPLITAPGINQAAFRPGSDVPSFMPLLFITIACGAISGFHSLASSGTTVKQVNNEKDMQFVGYGGMIWESFLAVLVLIAIAAGLGMGYEENGVVYLGTEAFRHHYASWLNASGLEANLKAFVSGSANLLNAVGIPFVYAQAMIAVFIVSFANTTLDSTARIQRLSLQELVKNNRGEVPRPFNNRYFSTFILILLASLLAFAKPGAKGALMLWPLFGSLNQLLAALALGVITIYLIKNRINYLFGFLPMLFVLSITVWAMFENLIRFYIKEEWLLVSLSGIILFLTAWLLGSGIISLIKFKKEGSVLIPESTH